MNKIAKPSYFFGYWKPDDETNNDSYQLYLGDDAFKKYKTKTIGSCIEKLK